MSHEIDDPERRVAERVYVRTESSGIVTLPERPKSVGQELVELLSKLEEDLKRVTRKNLATAKAIRSTVSKRAPRLAMLDSDLFPEISVVGEDGSASTTRLLEVLGSGRVNGLPFEFFSHRFNAIVTYITQDGKVIDLVATRRQRGGRVIFGEIEPRETSPEKVVNFQRGIFEALNSAIDRGTSKPQNYR